MPRGLGPVFAYEWLTSSRRWQGYALRSLFVAALLAGLTFVWLGRVGPRGSMTFQNLGQIGEAFYTAIIGIQLTLVLLAAPAATAGAICQDKARGTLAHMLMTDLSDAEIVLGKLAARLIPVVGLVACTLPVLALVTLLGGVDPVALLGAFLITLGLAVLGCSLALALSVWARKTHEVVLATYALWGVWLLFYPILYAFGLPTAYALAVTNPFWLAFAPYGNPGTTTWLEPAVFLAVSVAISGALTYSAVVMIRRAYLRQADRPVTASWSWLPKWSAWRCFGLRWVPRYRPFLDGNPVLWREWHRQRPSRWVRAVWILYFGLALVFSGLVVVQGPALGRVGADFAPFVAAFQVSVGLLFVSIAAPTSLAEERVRGSLDVILTTPMTTRAIVWGKWWGAFRTVPCLTIIPAATVFLLACQRGERWLAAPLMMGLILAYGAVITSLGLTLATWIPRLGRAVALNVIVYVLMTVGWMFLVLLMFNRGPGHDGRMLAQGSPFFGPGQLTVTLSYPSTSIPEWNTILWGTVFWIFVHGALAAVLLGTTLATFNRCLGRLDDSFRPLPAPIPRKPKPKAEPILAADWERL